MNPYGADDVPAHRTLGPGTPEPPVAAPADIEAWKARKKYPSTLFAGGPVFGTARERAEGGWELRRSFAGLAPQDARGALACHLRRLSAAAAGQGDAAAAADLLAAAELLDRERPQELTVRGERFRVIRAERFIRMGPDGPEPPRATDPDPGVRGRAGDPRACPDPAAGLVVGPAGAAHQAEGVLRAELLAALRRKGTVPRDVREGSRFAAHTHPAGVLLPATFMAAEREGGRWRPQSTGTAATPGDARDQLALQLRVMVPWQQDLTPREHELYKRAADRLDEEQCDDIAVAGRHFRIVRVERLLRVGPDGPEGPRPSDADTAPTGTARDRRHHLQGRDAAEEDADRSAPEPDAGIGRFMVLFEQERPRLTRLDQDDGP